jgi:hypothetical protein
MLVALNPIVQLQIGGGELGVAHTCYQFDVRLSRTPWVFVDHAHEGKYVFTEHYHTFPFM